MNLREFLVEVGHNYDRNAPMSSSAQLLLRSAKDELAHLVPGGMLVIGSGGQGNPAFVPWIGIFDPDETTSPQDGVYVVFLYSTGLDKVALSLNQGITGTSKRLHSYKKAREILSKDADAIRKGLPSNQLQELTREIELDPAGIASGRYDENLRSYTAANIAAKTYTLSDLPSENLLRADLKKLLGLYSLAISEKRRLLQSAPGTIGSASAQQNSTASDKDPLREFKPKSDSDYIAHLKSRELVKTRRHETLVKQYGQWANEHGFKATTEHPKDLVLRRQGKEWLVEAKIVRHGNAMYAVREAIGQILMYRRLNYEAPPDGLVALFSEEIGDVFAEVLEELDITAVWKSPGAWSGTERADKEGLTTAATSSVEMEDAQ